MKKILLEEIRTKQYENNIERYGEYSDTCICCGKRTVLKILLLLADENQYEYRKRNFEIKFGYKE